MQWCQLGMLLHVSDIHFCTQTDVRQAFLEYRYKAAVPGGSLLIKPIAEQQMHDTTELLTQSFSEAMGYMSVYRCRPALGAVHSPKSPWISRMHDSTERTDP